MSCLSFLTALGNSLGGSLSPLGPLGLTKVGRAPLPWGCYIPGDLSLLQPLVQLLWPHLFLPHASSSCLIPCSWMFLYFKALLITWPLLFYSFCVSTASTFFPSFRGANLFFLRMLFFTYPLWGLSTVISHKYFPLSLSGVYLLCSLLVMVDPHT